MTSVRIEPILPKHKIFDATKYSKAIENAGTETAKAVQVDFNVTTLTWNRKPDFKISHNFGSWEWIIATDSEIYGYVSEGTPPHEIRAKNVKTLHFFGTGFRPKSRVGWIGSNKGKAATSGEAFPVSVHHPGIKAREYPEAIKKKWDQEWPRQLQRAINAAKKYGG